MVAVQPGSIPESILGLKIIIKKQRDELSNEVKRMGYLVERKADVELRLGDVFVLYISKSNA